MIKFKGIIFDVDGTLVNTNKLIFASFRYVVEKYSGRNLADEEIISLFGPTEEVILKEWMKDKYEIASKEYFDFYAEHHDEMAEVHEGIKELLEFLKEKNINLSVFTGKGRRSTVITLRHFGLLRYFDLIVTGDEVKEHKPSPEGINLFIEKFNLSRENVLMVGDAPADIKAAKSAGVKCATVLWDSYARENVKKMGSDYYFESVGELLDFCKWMFL